MVTLGCCRTIFPSSDNAVLRSCGFVPSIISFNVLKYQVFTSSGFMVGVKCCLGLKLLCCVIAVGWLRWIVIRVPEGLSAGGWYLVEGLGEAVFSCL